MNLHYLLKLLNRDEEKQLPRKVLLQAGLDVLIAQPMDSTAALISADGPAGRQVMPGKSV